MVLINRCLSFQVYVIRAKQRDAFVSVAYALLPTKTRTTYERLFQGLVEVCTTNGWDLRPRNVMMDFEEAAMAAVSSTWGVPTNVRGCFFHLTQSTWRKIQQLGQVESYKQDAVFRHFCGMMDGLAFLPVDKVQEGMDFLRTVVPANANDLLDYFDATYVSGRMQAQAGDGLRLNLQRNPPKFPPHIWNVHEPTITGESRTNNACEGWNNAIRAVIGHAHPALCKLVKGLQTDAQRNHILLLQAETGLHQERVHRKRDQLQRRLHNLCSDYRANVLTLEQFMRSIGHTVRLTRVA